MNMFNGIIMFVLFVYILFTFIYSLHIFVGITVLPFLSLLEIYPLALLVF